MPTVTAIRRVFAVFTMAMLLLVLAAGAAHAQVKKVLVLGDSDASGSVGNRSLDYLLAAKTQMEGVVGAVNVTYIAGMQLSTPALTPADMRQPDGSKYDVVVLVATYKGIAANNRAVIKNAIVNGDANAFFLFPDQCNVCTANVDQITMDWIPAITGWNLSTGLYLGTPNGYGFAELNTGNTTLSGSFTGAAPLVVNNYTTINGVPEANVLYMPRSQTLANNTNAATGLVSNVAALVVPRDPAKQHACVFVISDVNPWYNGAASPKPNPNLAQAVLNASSGSTCSAGNEGSITIDKTLAALPAGVTGPFQAQFVAECSLAGQNSTYLSALTTLSVGSQSILINSIPADSSCTITETLDAAPAGYAWTQVLPTAPLTVIAGQTVHAPITNTLAAIPPTVGSIRVNKTLVLNSQVAQASMQFMATCDLPSAGSVYTSQQLVMGTSGTEAADINNIPAGAECVLSEDISAAPTGFSWQQTIPTTPITVVAGQTVSANVTNTLTPLPAGTGVIRVTKTLTVPSEITTPFQFQFTATCGAASFSSPVITMANNSDQTTDITGVPLNTNCSVTEQLPAAPANYHWAVISPQATTVSATATPALITFDNVLTRGLGTLTINTTLTIPATVTDPITLQFTATCDAPTAGTTHTVSQTFTVSGTQSTDIADLPAGANCEVTTQLPAAPANHTWQTELIAPVTKAIPDAGVANVDVSNALRAIPVASPAAVPALGPLSLLGLSSLLGGGCAWCLRRRRAKSVR